MRKESWIVFSVLFCIMAVILCFYKWPYGLGYILGSVLAVYLYKRNESYWGAILDIGTVKGARYLFHFAINMAIMALPMVVAALKPQLLNIFCVALGLLMIKITVVVEVFLQKGGIL